MSDLCLASASASLRPSTTPGVCVVVALATSLVAARAEAQSDGAYGRLERDLTLSIGVGGGPSVAPEVDPEGVVVIDARMRWLDCAGLVIAPEIRPVSDARVVVAVDVRPLFPLRFFLGWELGSWCADLLIDSIGVEVGAAILPLGDGIGAALAVGVGIDVPIVPPWILANGLFLRLAGRHVRARAADQAAPEGGVSDWLLHAVLTLRFGVSTGLVGREMPRWRPDP